MSSYIDYEFKIFRDSPYEYKVELQINNPEVDRIQPSERWTTRLTQQSLQQSLLSLSDDTAAYGRFLRDEFFTAPDTNIGLQQMFGVRETVTRRLRLIIESSAPELHAIRWETLREPGEPPYNDRWLLANEHVRFSRLLTQVERAPSAAKPRDSLRALVLIASPNDLVGPYDETEDWPAARAGIGSSAPLDVAAALRIARHGLDHMFMDVLVSTSDQPGRASLANLQAALRAGYDILYLVCHGGMIKSTRGDTEPHLLLEAADGTSDLVSGSKLIEIFSQMDLGRPPRLIILAACQTAGRGGMSREKDKEAALAALGPELARRAVPAVLAIQDNISTNTLQRFMRSFFVELREHGEIDRAAAAARGHLDVRDQLDAWMPTLYMSLKSGMVWYTPHFTGPAAASYLPGLVASIDNNNCVPILGPGLTDATLGTAREIASKWAEAHSYSLTPRYRDELPIVSQYILSSQSLSLLRSLPAAHLKDRLERSLSLAVAEDPARVTATFDTLFERLHAQDSCEPHALLAELPIRIYLTVNQDDLLGAALSAAGKTPVICVCRWKQPINSGSARSSTAWPIKYYRHRDTAGATDTANVVPKDWEPSVQQPLVYHLFGHMKWPESLMLTEDDYFDYLMLSNSGKSPHFAPIDPALRRAALAFLGFRIDDWRFRVLFRSVFTDDRLQSRALERDPSVAVQVNPEDGTFGPERARRYLEEYFHFAHIHSYWGSAAEFIRALREQWREKHGAAQ